MNTSIITKIRQIDKQKGLFLLGLALLLVATVCLVGYRAYIRSHAENNLPKTKVVVKQVVYRRSIAVGTIVKATTAKTIDVATGKVIKAARIFSFNDKTVYLALDLNNAAAGTNIDYIRYLNGRYVDHGNVKIFKSATKNLNFSWTNIRSLGSVGDGKWKISTYTNGILEKRVTYLVQKSLAIIVYPDEQISLTDKDYRLKGTLAFLTKTQ